MKKFIAKLSDKQKHLFSQELLISHVDHLKKLTGRGVLQTCGPCGDGSAFMIMIARDVEEAKNYLESDPFSKVDYYKNRVVVEFFEATMENNFWLSN